MNSNLFASHARRYLVSAALVGSTFAGTLGLSTVASAEERVVFAAPPLTVVAPGAGIQVVAKAPSIEVLRTGPAPVEVIKEAPAPVEVIKERPVVEVVRPRPVVEVVRPRPIVEVAPMFYGGYGRPVFGGFRGGPGFRGELRGGECHGGRR